MSENEIRIISFSNRTNKDRKLLKKFVQFHWSHYKNDANYIPLLNYEYLGFKLIGMTGFFEPQNLFFKHAEMVFFMAMQNNQFAGRCNAFINHNYNDHWHEKTGFFGQFETIDDVDVAKALIQAAGEWVKSRGMNKLQGPQPLPVNEATPGLMTLGFDSRPVIYYHYNKPYYEKLILETGLQPVKKVLSWEVPVNDPVDEKLQRVTEKVIERFNIKIESWDQRPFEIRRQEMFEIYNDAWSDNFSFVPFTQEEFFSIVNDMQLVMDKGLFLFLYVHDEPAAFFGGIPNVFEKLKPVCGSRHLEFFRAIKLLLAKNHVKGFRLGYLGVKKKFRRLGLDGVMIWKQKEYSQNRGYEYCDMGWVLEDNVLTHRLVELVNAQVSKEYTIYQKPL